MSHRELNKDINKYACERHNKLKSACTISICKEHVLPSQLRIPACITKCSLNFLHSQSKLPCKLGIVSCCRKGKVDSCSDKLIFKVPYTSIRNSCSFILFLRSSFCRFPLINSAGAYSGLLPLCCLEAEQKMNGKKHR